MNEVSNWKTHADAAVIDIDAAIAGDEIYILEHLNDARKNIELAIDAAEKMEDLAPIPPWRGDEGDEAP